MLDTSRNISAAIPDNLARVLEQDIIFGRLEPSVRLTEETLAEAYGVSRSPVREALRLLERDGLVVREARKGIWVAPLSVKDLDEVYSVRVQLEGLAAMNAARSTDANLQGQLKAVLDDMRRAADGNNREGFFLADVRGSQIIHQMSGNATLTRLLVSLDKQAWRYRYRAYLNDPQAVLLSMEESALIIDAIITGNEAAKMRTEELILKLWHLIREDLE